MGSPLVEGVGVGVAGAGDWTKLDANVVEDSAGSPDPGDRPQPVVARVAASPSTTPRLTPPTGAAWGLSRVVNRLLREP
jgi:hypothetical protein